MAISHSLHEHVQQHYGRSDLAAAILEALEGAGKDVDNLAPEDLAPVDEFHVRGREATLELAEALGLDADTHVLDVGSGVGGPSRCIAREFGCRVTGIDLTEEYCDVATMLAELVALADRVSYQTANALELPFEDDSFDVVWTQHVAMNIPDKERLYSEMYRVLKPGGAVAIYDILAGPGGEVLFPVPWARTPETSFVAAPEALREHLEQSGFSIERWDDTTEPAQAWFADMAAKIQRDGMPPLGFHLLMGDDFKSMAQNQRRNLDEGRIVLAQVIARK